MVKWFQKYSFYIRIQLSLLFFILLPLISASFIAYVAIKDITLEKVKASQHNVINMIAHDVTKSVEDIIYATNLISFNRSPAFIETLKDFKDVSSLKSSKDYHNLMYISEYIDLVFSKVTGLKASIFYLNQQDYIVYGNNNELDYQSLKTWVGNFTGSDWENQLNTNYIHWMQVDDLKVSNGSKTESFYIAVRPIEHIYTGERLGTLFIGIPDRYFEQVLSSVDFGEIDLVDARGDNIFSYSLESQQDNRQSNQVELRSAISNTGWELIYRFSYKEVTKELTYVFRLHILLITICLIIFVFISIFIGRKLYRPLDKLRRIAESFGEDDRVIRFPVKGKDELSILGIAFNNMLDRINRLIRNVEQGQEEKRMFELQALFAQIHPHFLLNTLNSVKCNLVLSGDEVHSKQIGSLMSLLRAYMRVNEMNSLNDECKLLIDYTNILKMRTEMDFQFIIQLPDSLQQFMIPRLMLQPIVENAIIHGFSNSAEQQDKRCITIDAYEANNSVIIDVRDNGKGVSPSTLASLNTALELGKEPNASNQRIGLPNVQRRLKLTFGDGASIKVYENKERGLMVSIRIPLADRKESALHAKSNDY